MPRRSRATSLPSTSTRPSVGSSSRRMSLSRVDLPAPECPTRKTNSPSATWKSMSSSAGLSLLLYILVTCSKSIMSILLLKNLFGTEVPSLNLSVSLRSTRPGCGSQHPLRALISTRVLLAAAPTMTPCFRHWRRSSLLPLPRGASGEEEKFSAMPRPPLDRGGGTP